MNLKNLNSKLASLPLKKKALLLLGLIICFGLVWNFLVLAPQFNQISLLKEELARETKTLEENLKLSQNLSSFKKEVEGVRQELLYAQAQLPTEKEIPNLLTKISDLGNLNGLEFELFQPQGEKTQDFYCELPISMKVKGSYWNVTHFFEAVSNLDRIVTIDNFSMKDPKVEKEAVILETCCEAVTYRFQPNSSSEKNQKEDDQKKNEGGKKDVVVE